METSGKQELRSSHTINSDEKDIEIGRVYLVSIYHYASQIYEKSRHSHPPCTCGRCVVDVLGCWFLIGGAYRVSRVALKIVSE